MTNLVILSSHAVLEYDDLRMFTRLGYDVFMPGGYADPRQPGPLRPAVPEAPYHPELVALVQEQREKHAGESQDWPIIDWGKCDLHPGIIDWADIIMVNCFPESWIAYQWQRIREKRVIWRTIGQSDPAKERLMRPLKAQGLEIVRYSPAERRAFEPLGIFAGEDAVIRFGKDPADYGPWTGRGLYQDGAIWTDHGAPYIANVTQNMKQRGDACDVIRRHADERCFVLRRRSKLDGAENVRE